ncbi:MAG: leucine-rich repeat domain-containing protein [Phycisphaera sp.]|nr:leucine-rich repeat domain-containing protein [Phycisphaera sp.]
MVRTVMKPIVLTLVFVILQSGTEAHAASIFPDKNLEAAVRRQVFAKRDSKDPLTPEDVRHISTIDGAGMGIKNLTGLENCTALAEVKLDNNHITDLTPLKGLKRLQSMKLDHNDIADISPLADLDALQYLDLSHNRVADLGPLKDHTKLSTLYLTGNQISDVSPLSGLRAWSVYLGGNPISDYAPLANLSRVSTLELSHTNLVDLTPIAALAELRVLFLQGNRITDLQALVNACEQDAAGDRRFAPYLRVFVAGNRLSPAAIKTQIPKLESFGVRVDQQN